MNLGILGHPRALNRPASASPSSAERRKLSEELLQAAQGSRAFGFSSYYSLLRKCLFSFVYVSQEDIYNVMLILVNS